MDKIKKGKCRNTSPESFIEAAKLSFKLNINAGWNL